MDTWSALRPALCAHCLHVLDNMGFIYPTPVQVSCPLDSAVVIMLVSTLAEKDHPSLHES